MTSAATPSAPLSGQYTPRALGISLMTSSYHAQLIFVLIKLPSDIRLGFSYAHVFVPSASVPVTLCSLTFERAATLFNLASLYFQFATSEDRSSPDGLK
ncbi:hypothetical protein JVT61DRAFT_9015 [Boletus reticuloceps]|uniref:BRO1 domain-containing protein n=1 Tax=Boletus reticuloceps TaxID=495285 RepID=A0A8I2YH79_9AGAM|nr:hypothetical protein JVT61DRAFT_9015 [Boletus reticuloceps]